MGKLMYMDKTYSSTVENCTGLKYDNASSGLDAENVQDAIDETNSNLSQLSNQNLFINGNFQIWQRGEEFTVAINEDGTYGGYVYTADKWIAGAWGSDVAHVYKNDKGLTFSRERDTSIKVFQQLEEETLKGILGKSLTMSYGIEDATGTYQEYRRNIVLDENIEIEPFIIAEENFCIELQRGYTLIWAKLEVSEIVTPCVPDSKDAIICKLEQEIDDLNDKLTNKTTWKYLGEATNGNKLTLPNPDKYEELLIVASSSNVDLYCKYTFSLCKYLIENFYTGAYEYLKEGYYANEYYYGEIIVEFSNSKNGNYIKLNAVHYKGNDIGGTIHVCYR